MRKNKKHLDFELNLIPFIDLLSVCICFLLLTAVWMHLGSMDVKQAIGGQAAGPEAPKATLWVDLNGRGELVLELKDAGGIPANLRRASIAAVSGKPDLTALSGHLAQLKAAAPGLATALVQPQAQAAYEDIIDVMDEIKRAGVADLGVTPL